MGHGHIAASRKVITKKRMRGKKKCYRCVLPYLNHVKECKIVNLKCLNCSKVGHFAKVCHQKKTVQVIEDKSIDGRNNDESGS